MKWIFLIFVYLCSTTSFAVPFNHLCQKALPVESPSFCASFKTAAECNCTQSGLPRGLCQDPGSIYNRMISVFGSLKRACEYQHQTSAQDCIDGWTCFRTGGKSSQGMLCSSTGKSCL